MKIKFCDYIKQIKEKFERHDTYLFIRKEMKDIHLITDIRGKKVFTFEIGESRWEEVEWDVDDTDIIYPISVKEILKNEKIKQN